MSTLNHIQRIASLITEDPDIIDEAQCPECMKHGNDQDNAELGFSQVWCPEPGCKNFNQTIHDEVYGKSEPRGERGEEKDAAHNRKPARPHSIQAIVGPHGIRRGAIVNQVNILSSISLDYTNRNGVKTKFSIHPELTEDLGNTITVALVGSGILGTWGAQINNLYTARVAMRKNWGNFTTYGRSRPHRHDTFKRITLVKSRIQNSRKKANPYSKNP